ncbi:Oidioi.mRNA.OKI2018_I69.XSR.g13583.t1.cds [Oikopleura dioica]|uniref:Oidioi.mRNA.OKI2018_I69.XSR.g13583.t1.cds n=1 Tax=Oikopleura dioica TaxID=34765 RepID=A0ABN7SCE7_OIKDI|nr:Oidioi.mRNA.OKI2018_I69.XSR.g13583.t1.cds [Oikopleura dioica]
MRKNRLRSDQIMSEDRVAAEEMCLRQRSRILEQIREIKRIDVDTFHYETLYQTMTDEFEEQIEEMRILEMKSRMATRILEIQEMIQKSTITAKKLTCEIDEIRTRRLRSHSEPVNQSTPTKKKWRDSNEENKSRGPGNYASNTFSRRRDPTALTMKSYSSMTPASRRRPGAGSTAIVRSKSQSYRETQSDAQLVYRANFLRNRNAPSDTIQNPQRKTENKPVSEQCTHTEVHVKLAERKALMARSVSDMALVDRIGTLPFSKSERKLNSYDNDSDTGISSMHSSEADFRCSPDRKITLV